MITCISISVQAYLTIEFSNHTHEELKIRIHLASDPMSKWYEAVIQPKQEGHVKAMHTFAYGPDAQPDIRHAEHWKGWFCLHEVQIQTPLMEKKESIDDDGNIKVTYVRKYERDSNGKPMLNTPMWNPWRNLQTVAIPDDSYNQMVAAGSMLADGLVEAAATVATAASGVPIPSFKVSGIVGGIGKLYAYGKCKELMHFDLVPTTDTKLPSEIFYIIALTVAR